MEINQSMFLEQTQQSAQQAQELAEKAISSNEPLTIFQAQQQLQQAKGALSSVKNNFNLKEDTKGHLQQLERQLATSERLLAESGQKAVKKAQPAEVTVQKQSYLH